LAPFIFHSIEIHICMHTVQCMHLLQIDFLCVQCFSDINGSLLFPYQGFRFAKYLNMYFIHGLSEMWFCSILYNIRVVVCWLFGKISEIGNFVVS